MTQALKYLLPVLLCAGRDGQSQAPPDSIVFTNGEKLVGHLIKSSGDSVTFKSDIAGQVTVPWAKVQELHTADQFAVIPTSVKVAKKENVANLPQGSLAMADQKIVVTPPSAAASPPVPVAEAQYVVEQADFQKYTKGHPGFFSDWNGGVTAGIALVEATQKSQNYTGAITLSRTEPAVEWLNPSNRTIANFNISYGKVTQPHTPDIKTEIYHADLERDEYFTPRVYFFVQAAFDHNFSQGLNFQQLYGGGIGWTALKTPKQQLDLKASVNYIQQSFAGNAKTQNLIGSTFGDTYFYKFPGGFVLNQNLTFVPAWNNTSAFTGLASAALVIPAYKRMNFSLSALDTFLNNPPVGFKKNSFQITAGLTYGLR
jgi:hypothetical protein